MFKNGKMLIKIINCHKGSGKHTDDETDSAVKFVSRNLVTQKCFVEF